MVDGGLEPKQTHTLDLSLKKVKRLIYIQDRIRIYKIKSSLFVNWKWKIICIIEYYITYKKLHNDIISCEKKWCKTR